MPRDGKKAVTMDEGTVDQAREIGQEEDKSVPEVFREALRVYKMRRDILDDRVRRIIRILDEQGD